MRLPSIFYCGVVGSAVIFIFCQDSHPPCFGVQVGARFAITVVEPYDQNSQYTFALQGPGSCELGFDLTSGQVLEATVIDSTHGDIGCSIAFPAIAPFGDWTWTPRGGSTTSLLKDVLGGGYTSTSSQCTGPSNLDIYSVAGDPFSPSVPGELPHVVLERDFFGGTAMGDAGASCGPCLGYFVVNLQKL